VKKNKNKRMLVIITCLLIIIECTTVFLMYKSLSNKKPTLDEVKILNNSSSSGMFAVMLENQSGEYVQSQTNSWPTSGYTFNSERSGCMDSSGKKIPNALEFSNGVARIKTNKKVSCYMYFDVEATAFAIYSDDDNSLRFYKNRDMVEVGDIYKGLSVTNIYTGFEKNSYTWYDEVPWYAQKNDITSVVVEETIKPISISFWFYMYNVSYMNVAKLDTSNVITMQRAFGSIGRNVSQLVIDGLSNWNTSNVTSMYALFREAGYSADAFEIDLSSWDTKKVVYMDSMFASAGYEAATFSVGDLSNWDTSSVVNMVQMFENAGYNATYYLDLSSWNVSKVTSYGSFNAGVTAKVIAPNFSTTS